MSFFTKMQIENLKASEKQPRHIIENINEKKNLQ